MQVPASKVEVIEFIWYSCLHFGKFESNLKQWKGKQGKTIVFRRVPVAFSDQFIPQSKMLLALDMLGLSSKLTPAIFEEIHLRRNRLLNIGEQADFLAKKGVDKKKYLDAPTMHFLSPSNCKAYNSLASIVKVLEYLVRQAVAKKDAAC
ncbi:thiol:disulfide interchange protein [Candidatus Vallotia tarda]|uniref:Thiol:disulfide interchange protein dsbA n=1 Tax=Candidatus Vallotiella hemipterorum TaxID=1177213 RepID=A0A916NK36_9BURK|nr:thiol:disulfide interchange protein [Candidatus Vallotia tarda]CAG7595876.1 Thiol:disulfide interchange protein dsbA [Candidatus Vallotia tarda]